MKKTIITSLLIGLCQCVGYAQETAISYSINDLANDGTCIYAATPNGVVMFDTDSNVYKTATLPDSLLGVQATSLDCNKEGKAYVGFANGQIFNIKGHEYEYVGTLPDKGLNKLRFDDNGNMFACCRSLYKKTSVDWERYSLPDSEQYSSLSIYDICPDENGNIWIGARLVMGGAYKFDGEKITLVVDNTRPIMSVAYNNGQVWMGSAQNGLYLYENESVTNNFTLSNSDLKENFINAICADTEGNIWCGRNYLHKYSQGTFTAYDMPDDAVITSIANIGKTIYIGTTKGLYVLKNNDVVPVTATTDISSPSEVKGNTPQSFYDLQGKKVNGTDIRHGSIYIKHNKKFIKH